jgi:tetratricopeptide (TPR) repeat protein
VIGGIAALLYFLEKVFLGESKNSSTAASLIEQRYWQSLELNQALERRDGIAKDYADLGNFYKKQGNRPQAEEMYLKSIQLYQEIGDSHAQVVQQWLEKLQTDT